MKNVILFAAAFIGLIAVSSCQKDKSVNSPTNANTVSRASNTAQMKPILVFGPDKYRIYYDYGGTAFGCVYVGGNCLDEIVVVVPKVRQLMSAVVGGDDYVGYIRTNMEDLSACIPGEYLQGVVNATYTLSVRDDQQSDMQYLKFEDSKGIALVIPVSKK